MEAKTSKDSVKKPEDDLNIGFSKMGGEDIRRQMEWFQGQWKKFAGLKVNLKSAEQGMYINTLRSSAKPDLFRKGMSLDVPTCLNALETLTPGHPENYIEYNNPKFTNLVGVLRKTTDQNLRKSICSQAMQVVMDDHVMIPLGEIHYTILAKANWTGWRLNELNQMDLSDLKLVSK